MDSRRFCGGAGGKRTLVWAGGLIAAMHLAPVAFAAPVSDANDLTDAFTQAHDNHENSTTITLQNNISASPGATMLGSDDPTSSLTIDTSNFTLTLDGAGTVLDGASTHTINLTGAVGVTALTVSNGAQFFARGGFPNSLSFYQGNLQIIGNGSQFNVGGDFMVGRGGDAGISLTNGGQINTDRAFIGEDPATTLATNINVLVDGGSTVWNTNYFAEGGASNVNVTVSGGAKILGNSGGINAVIGRSGTASLLVTGAGSQFITGDNGGLYIGFFQDGTGHGTVTISDGGLVSSGFIVMGDINGSTGSLTVDSGGVLETAGLIYFPGIGTATVTFDNGTLRALADSVPGSVLIYGFSGTDFNIGSGGMFLDSNGFNVVSSSVMSGVGGLTKQGDGIFNLTGSNTYGGPTLVSRGILQAGIDNAFSPASAHTVASGATLDTGGFNQTIARLDNSGTVTLLGSAPGSTLRVTGDYVGHDGLLKLGTALGDSSSISDRLVIDGPGASAGGTTTVQITNFGGLGAQTTGNGIEVIGAINGATTTAQTTKSAFGLAGGHVDAGAYEYRLYAADANGDGENWYLRSSLPPPPGGSSAPPGPGGSSAPPGPGGGAAPIVTYRTEVPLFAALPEQLRQSGLAMLGNLHQRVGDNAIDGGDMSADAARKRQAWGRVISVDREMSQGGTVSPASAGRLTGFQAGTDLWADTNWRGGVYVGQLDGDMSVNGFASGIAGRSVGSNSLSSQYFGAYVTYHNEGGWYADTVLQAGRHEYDVNPIGGAGSNGSGRSLLASIELGKSFQIASGWRIEPQLQLVHQSMDLDDPAIPNAMVQQSSDNGWMMSAGLRIKGEASTAAGTLQPYGRFNIYRSSNGTDTTRFTGSAGQTNISTKTGSASSELVAGATLQVNRRVSLYGEFGKLWAASDTVRTASGINGSLGAKILW